MATLLKGEGRRQFTTLRQIIHTKQIDLLKAALSLAKAYDEPLPWDLLTQTDAHGDQPLFYAIQESPDLVFVLLTWMRQCNDDYTVLSLLAHRNAKGFTVLLTLCNQAKQHLVDEDKWATIHTLLNTIVSLYKRHQEERKYWQLLCDIFNGCNNFGFYPLQQVIVHGNFELFKRLSDTLVALEDRDLILAVFRNRNNSGVTPFIAAVTNQRWEMVESMAALSNQYPELATEFNEQINSVLIRSEDRKQARSILEKNGVLHHASSRKRDRTTSPHSSFQLFRDRERRSPDDSSKRGRNYMQKHPSP